MDKDVQKVLGKFQQTYNRKMKVFYRDIGELNSELMDYPEDFSKLTPEQLHYTLEDMQDNLARQHSLLKEHLKYVVAVSIALDANLFEDYMRRYISRKEEIEEQLKGIKYINNVTEDERYSVFKNGNLKMDFFIDW